MKPRRAGHSLVEEALPALTLFGALFLAAVGLTEMLGLRLWLTSLEALALAVLGFIAAVTRRVTTDHAPKATPLRRALRIAGIGSVLVAGLGLGGPWLAGSGPGGALRATVVERLLGETPEAKVQAYVRAVSRGDEKAAVESWTLPGWELPNGRSDALRTRRLTVTRRLLTIDLDRQAQIEHIEWWRTCCEPGLTGDPRNAGGARLRVRLLDREGTPHVYTFDVFSRDGPYWGAAMGYPPRRWALYDVYPTDEEPLYWTDASGPAPRR